MIINGIHSNIASTWSPIPLITKTSDYKLVYYNKDLDIYCSELPLISNSIMESDDICDSEPKFPPNDHLVNLYTRDLRKNANIEDANLYASVLEEANLDNIKYNEKTKFFSLYCPEEGAFIAYKKGLNNRIIKLLIPGDAKRVSATRNCCRCDKAKVLEISDFEKEKYFDEAWSTVAEGFCYKLGDWVYAKNFNEDRWYDSTGGIHFWMTREEAKKY